MAQKPIQNFIKTLSELVRQAKRELINPKLESLNDDTEVRQFLFACLFKLTNGLDTISSIAINIEENPQFSDSIFILFRALLADMITLDHMLVMSDMKNENLARELDKLKFDHARSIFHGMKTFKKLYNATESEIEKKRELLRQSNPDKFDEQGKVKKEFRGKGISQMAVEIQAQTPRSKFQDDVVIAFEHYDIYSKLEHLGALTPQLVFRGYEPEKINSVIEEIKTCSLILIDFMYALLTEFYDSSMIKETEYWNQLEKLKSS